MALMAAHLAKCKRSLQGALVGIVTNPDSNTSDFHNASYFCNQHGSMFLNSIPLMS